MNDTTARAGLPAPEQGLYFSREQLIGFSRFFADEVCSGKFPFVDFDPEQRWHRRIYRDRRVDVWLISWLPSQGTQLHDHGGSSGAFTVLSGVLTEAVVTGGSVLHDHERGTGSTVGFGAHYVHDVRNLGDAPAVSVHAYSAPLTSMTYYDLADGALSTITTLATDDPEPDVEPLPVRHAS
ncbi:cysteine dioxygenase family protein [uncultured Jatrophihabitans sp.]|uniref:cysteine dioxygenase n=1 Tax=uncultured Jatrophihabitans sp. TaxID=1610747 RepID=UPI0035C959D2